MPNQDSFPSHFDPQQAAIACQALWRTYRVGISDPYGTNPAFSTLLPPPNVTGTLHMGHAFITTLEDTMMRYQSMCGRDTLWQPGVDHAGIATQQVVEKKLHQEGTSRHAIGREAFVNTVMAWKEAREKDIHRQLTAIGATVDSERWRFTLDPGAQEAVATAFKRLYDKGLIYRDLYLVPWDPVTQTALSNDEVEYEEEQGSLWKIRYLSEDGHFHIDIETTRPETLLGDTAIAVHPDDPRYQALIGKRVRVPLVERMIPIIADHRVEQTFGTGAVKVTPAHDPLDFSLGQTHHLPSINLLHPDGTFNGEGLQWEGQTPHEARPSFLKALGTALVGERPHLLRVGRSYRSKARIEPRLSTQWFFRLSSYKTRLKQMLEQGEVELFPKKFNRNFLHWVNNLQDWCISRQLWWGHTIPAWHHKEDGRIIVAAPNTIPPEVAQAPDAWRAETDVLDTWFSSALWPLTTMGWPNPQPHYDKFYPTSLLITGSDILFFWVTRMLVFCDELDGTIPFRHVWLTSLIYGKSYWRIDPEHGVLYIKGEERAALEALCEKELPNDVHYKWEKMSKSKGNVIDPVEVIEKHGADVLRLTLCSLVNESGQIDLDQRNFHAYSCFTNKVWNAARFVLSHIEKADHTALWCHTVPLEAEDQWFLHTLQTTCTTLHTHYHNYQLHHAAKESYHFIWHILCDYYIELAKPALYGRLTPHALLGKQQMLVLGLCAALRLLHPCAPFITEQLFGSLQKVAGPRAAQCCPLLQETADALRAACCARAPFPHVAGYAPVEQFDAFLLLLRSARRLKAQTGRKPSDPAPFTLHSTDLTWKTLLQWHKKLTALIPQATLVWSDHPPTANDAVEVLGTSTLALPIPQEQRIQEQQRLTTLLEKCRTTIATLKKRLATPSFCANAPAAVVAQTRDALHKAQEEEKSLLLRLTG